MSASAWQSTPLPRTALAALPQESRQYLSEVGLPSGIELWMANICAVPSTCRIGRCRSSRAAELIHAGQVDGGLLGPYAALIEEIE